MMGAVFPMKFKVMYKMPGQRSPVVADHVMDDLRDLLKFLARDGVTKESVEYMYVHYTPSGSSSTMELLAVENGKELPTATGEDTIKDPPKKSNVVNIKDVKHLAEARKIKPRIKANEVRDLGLVAQGLFTAMRGA